MSEEPALPYTPTHASRRARVGYLGFAGVGFHGLWPFFAGAAASGAALLYLFLGGSDSHRGWMADTALGLAPVLCGYAYLQFLVVGRPPHFKGDLLETLRSARADFGDPPVPAFPLIPRISFTVGSARGPRRSREGRPRRAGR